MDDRVSIVIPVYNTEDYVEESIQSTLNQTYSNVEVIAVDDGSTDRSLEILQNYSDKITVIPIKHGGQSVALNAGIRKMNGSWFKLFGADDILFPNAIEELILESEKFENKKQNIFLSNFRLVNPQGEALYEFREPDYNSMNQFNFNVLLLDHFIGNIITSLVHKSTIDEYGGFNESFKRVQDYEIWLRYCLQYNVKMHFIPKVLVKNRWHDKTLTNTLPKKDLRREEKEVKKHVLSKLEPILRQRYEITLKQYQHKSLAFQGYRLTNHLLKRTLPKHVTDNIARKYGKYFHYSQERAQKIEADRLEFDD